MLYDSTVNGGIATVMAYKKCKTLVSGTNRQTSDTCKQSNKRESIQEIENFTTL